MREQTRVLHGRDAGARGTPPHPGPRWRAADRAATRAVWDLLVRYGQRGGRRPLAEALGPRDTGRISLSSRGLSNNEINRCLARLRDILELAREEFGVDVRDGLWSRLRTVLPGARCSSARNRGVAPGARAPKKLGISSRRELRSALHA
jgi:hypothetical protein